MTNPAENDVQGFDDAPRNMFKFPKWSIAALAALTVLIIVALIAPSFLDQAKYKDLVIRKVAESTGYAVTWKGDLGISILPVPHVTIHEATLSNGAQKILSIKQAEISVKLMPLLNRQIQISNVKLVEPDIDLLVDASGRQTWMTEKLKTQKTQSETRSGNFFAEDKKPQSVTLDSLQVEKGHVAYRDLSKNDTQEISNLNADLDLNELTGPFDVRADLTYNGHDIALDGKTGQMTEGKPTKVDFNIELPGLDVEASYKGELTTGEAMNVKGDLKISANDIGKTASAFSKKKINLPDGVDGAFDLTAAVLYDGNNASLGNTAIAIGDLAYKGAIKVAGLKTSASPKLSVDLVSTAQNPKASNALVKIMSDLSVKGAGTFVDNIIAIEQGTIGFDGQTVNLSGSYMLAPPNGRARLRAKIEADRLDFDDLTRQMNPATESAAQKAVNAKNSASGSAPVQGVRLPFEGEIAGKIGNLNYGGRKYSNINFNLGSAGNVLVIRNFSLNTISDTSVSAKGEIANFEKLSGLNLDANIKTGNVENLARSYNIDMNLEQALGAASLSGKFTGSLADLGFNATADALNFAVTAVGRVKNPTSAPVVNNVNLRVRHPSLQAAVRNFSPSFEAPGSFNGPLDLSTTVSMSGKKYDVRNIRGKLGGTAIAGEISADMSGAKPFIGGDVTLGNMIFESPAPKAGTTTNSGKSSAAPATASESRWSREAIETGWMQKFNADLKIRASSITQGLWKLANARLAFKLNDGSLDIANMDANVFGGDVAINGAMKGGSARTPLAMNWTAKATDIDAQQFLSALQNKPSDVISGTIKSFNLDIASSGISPAALVYALSGKGSAAGSNLVIRGVDAAKLADAARGSYKPLERAGSLFASFKDGQTSFTTFNADFSIASGIVNFSQIKFDGPQAALSSTGAVNLPRWTIDLKNNMTVKNSEIPPFDFAISGPLDSPLQTGGSVIEGFLRQKAQAEIGKLIEDKLGKKLGLPAGILSGGTATTAPAADAASEAPSAPVADDNAPLTKEQKKQQQIEEGVKVIQGLFGN